MTTGWASIDWETGFIRYEPTDHYNGRVSEEEFTALRAAGFQHIRTDSNFRAVWSPMREDVLGKLFGIEELDDYHGQTMRERTEARTERFEELQDKRQSEATARFDAVHRLADAIPFGQPILVGHHSEGRARRDQDRIHNGMRKGIELQETAAYWSGRASAAAGRIERREKPDAIRRRIDKLEADRRSVLRRASSQPEHTEHFQRWAWFYDNRLIFERAFLAKMTEGQPEPLAATEMKKGGYLVVDIPGYRGVWKILRINPKTVSVEVPHWINPAVMQTVKIPLTGIKPGDYLTPEQHAERAIDK